MLVEVAKEKNRKKEKLYINSNLNTCMTDIVDMKKFTNQDLNVMLWHFFKTLI